MMQRIIIDSIPDNWKWTHLSDLLGYVIGGDWGKDPEFQDKDFGLAYCIRGSEIRNWNEEKGSTASLRKIKISNIEKRKLVEGDILLEISGGGPEQPVGRTVLIDKAAISLNPSVPKICTNFLRLMRPIENVNPKFLNQYLQFFYKSGEIIKYQGGSNNLRNLKFPDYVKIEVPLPPISTQNEIVSKIEELFSELDNGIESLKLGQQQLKVYRQSVLNTLVTDKNLKTIESLIIKLDQGWSPKCENESSKDKNEWAVIKTSAIQHGHFIDMENKRLPKALKPRIQHEIIEGDILITRAGPRVRVGVCCMVKRTRPKLINCDKVYRIKVNKEICLPEYLELILNSPYYLDEIEKMKTGISDSGLNLTQTRFLKIAIPVPSIKEQNKLVLDLESSLSVADKMEESLNQSLLQSEALRQSILKSAFEGLLITAK